MKLDNIFILLAIDNYRYKTSDPPEVFFNELKNFSKLHKFCIVMKKDTNSIMVLNLLIQLYNTFNNMEDLLNTYFKDEYDRIKPYIDRYYEFIGETNDYK